MSSTEVKLTKLLSDCDKVITQQAHAISALEDEQKAINMRLNTLQTGYEALLTHFESLQGELESLSSKR